MSILLKIDDLKSALKTVLPAAKNNQMDVLNHILLRIKGGLATLTAQDATREITASLECEGDDAELLLPAAKLNGIVSNSGAAPMLTLNPTDMGRVSVSINKSRFFISTLSPNDYPTLTVDEDHNPKLGSVRLTSSLLATDIKAIIDCVAVQDVRAYLNGLLFHLTEKHLHLVATNGHLIGWIQRECDPTLTDSECSVILPKITAHDLTRETITNCTVTMRQKTLTADYEPVSTLTTHLIDGKYPNWQTFFPDLHALSQPIIIGRYELLNALKYCQVMADRDQFGVRLDMEANRLTLTFHNQRGEEVISELTTETTLNEPRTIGASFVYLITLLNALNSAEVALYLNAENNLLHLLPNPQPDGAIQRYALMGMRL